MFGVPSEKWGETPIAAVILGQPGTVTAEELCHWINERVNSKNQRVHGVTNFGGFPTRYRRENAQEHGPADSLCFLLAQCWARANGSGTVPGNRFRFLCMGLACWPRSGFRCSLRDCCAAKRCSGTSDSAHGFSWSDFSTATTNPRTSLFTDYARWLRLDW
jgi:hypothetical protein